MSGFGSKTIRRMVCILLIAVAGTGTFSACLKDDDGLNQISAVRALNAVPGSSLLDIGLDAKQLNYNWQTGEVEDFAYGDALPYKNAWPGNRRVSVANPEEYPNAKPLAQGTVYFNPGQFYSLYVIGYDHIELMATEDDLSEPGEGTANVRFMNLSPDAPALDLGIEGEGTPITSNKAFKEYGGFVSIDAPKTYTFQLIEHASGEVVHTFTFTPENGMVYTVWAKGLFENEDDEELDFGHGIIAH